METSKTFKMTSCFLHVSATLYWSQLIKCYFGHAKFMKALNSEKKTVIMRNPGFSLLATVCFIFVSSINNTQTNEL